MSTQKQNQNNQCLSTLYASDQIVLDTVPVFSNFDKKTFSIFEDDIWDLQPSIVRENTKRHCLYVDFTSIADPYEKNLAKEYIFVRLNRKLPGHKPKAKTTSIRYELDRLRLFFNFCRKETNTVILAKITQLHLDHYYKELTEDNLHAPTRVSGLLAVVIELYHYRDLLSDGGLTFKPWNGKPAFLIAGCKTPTENTTPRIPEPIIGALLHWSLQYINTFSHDIFSAQDELNKLHQEHPSISIKSRHKTSYNKLRKRLHTWLQSLEEQGKKIPTWEIISSATYDKTGKQNPHINYAIIALRVGATRVSQLRLIPQNVNLISKYINKIGTEIGGLETPLTIMQDTGTPWRNSFDQRTLKTEQKMLQAACYVVISYLSGMRDSELQAMRTHCLKPIKSSDGLIEHYQIESTTYKGKTPHGVPDYWITIEPVSKAIHVLEKLTKTARDHRNLDTLWQVLHLNKHNKAHVGTEIVRTLNQYRDHINKLFGTPDNPAIPHHTNGKPWQFTTLQFRRTLAWYIANRPFGTVAGKIQYKHASIAMFESYSGNSASKFKAEIEQERALGQLDDIVEHYEDFKKGLKLTGSAAVRVQNEFQRVQEELNDFSGRFVEPTQIRSMLKHLAKNLHVGFLNDCFFEPAIALCLINKNENQAKPVLSNCSPDKCPNACLTKRHIKPWINSIEQADTLLKSQRISPLQRKILKDENKRKQKLIAPLMEKTNESNKTANPKGS